MFGYLTPAKEELKMKEYETYRAVYCGLCKELGRGFTPFHRLFLSNDFVFLTMLLCDASGEAAEIKSGRCTLHPLEKRNIFNTFPAMKYGADMSILLLYYKILDNIKDEGFFKRNFLYRPAKLLLSPVYNRLRLEYKGQSECMKLNLSKLSELEEKKEDSIDRPADTFARLLSELGGEYCDQPSKRIVSEILYHIGRYIYLMDACEDLAEDFKKSRYNPLPLRFKKTDDETIELFWSRIKEDVERTITMSLFAAGNAFDLLGSGPFHSILENIIFLGLPKRQSKLFSEKGEIT